MERLIKVFIDDPKYIQPKTIHRVFEKYREYCELDVDEEGLKRKELGEDINILMKTFTKKGMTWGLKTYGRGKHTISLITISQKIYDEDDPFKELEFEQDSDE